VRMKLIGTTNNNSWEIDSLKRSHSKWMVHVETHTRSAFLGGNDSHVQFLACWLAVSPIQLGYYV
jgi:hypothetical protein